jgi:hypothetical protein
MSNDIKLFVHLVLILIAVYTGYEMGKKKFPVQNGATINCEYTFPTLQTVIGG